MITLTDRVGFLITAEVLYLQTAPKISKKNRWGHRLLSREPAPSDELEVVGSRDYAKINVAMFIYGGHGDNCS